MSELAPFVAGIFRDEVVANLRKENDALREQVRNLSQLKDAFSEHVGSLAVVTEPDASYMDGPYCTGTGVVSPNRTIDFDRDDHGRFYFCTGTHALFNTEVHIDNQVAYRVKEADRVTCTQGDSDDQLEIDIAFGQVHLMATVYDVPLAAMHLWTSLDINPAKNPGQVEEFSNDEAHVGWESIRFESLQF